MASHLQALSSVFTRVTATFFRESGPRDYCKAVDNREFQDNFDGLYNCRGESRARGCYIRSAIVM